tara:strand:+ start:4513 stop:6453 length:1941 start_codon:yes stop_codon:yes gene_type:complete
MVEVSFGGAKDFKTLVSEQQANNKGQEGLLKVLEEISDTQNQMAQAQGVELQDKNKTDAKETEDKREQLSIFKVIKKGIFGVTSGIGNLTGIIEKSALDSAKRAAGGIFSLAKKFLFGGALIALLGFLDSEQWPEITEKALEIAEGLKNFVLSDFWPALKDFVFSPSWEELATLFKDYTVEMGTISAVVGTWAIVKIVGIVTSLGGAFTAIAAGLTAIGGVIGLGAAATGAVIVAVVAGILLTAKALYDAFKSFMDTWKETGSIMEAIKQAGIEFYSTIIGLPLDLLKDLTSYLLNALGFEEISKKLDSFSFEDIINGFLQNVSDFISNMFTAAIAAFTPSDAFIERITGIYDDLVGFFTSIPDKVGQKIEDIRNFFANLDLFGGIREFFANLDLFGDIREFFTNLNLFGDIREFFTNLDLFGGIREFFDNLDIFGSLRNFLSTFDPFKDVRDVLANLKLPELPDISELFEKTVKKVTDFFGGLFDINVKDIARAVIPDFLEGYIPFLKNDTPVEEQADVELEELVKTPTDEQKRIQVQTEIQEAKDRIARSESGENVYVGRDRIGRNQDRKLVEQLTTELKTLLGSAVAQANSELAEEKRTGGGSPIITNNNVVNNNNVSGGGSGGPVIPYPVKDNTIPNFAFPI